MSNNQEMNIAIWKLPHQQVGLPLERLDMNAASLDGAARQLPGGAYTTFRTFQRVRVLRLFEHFSRLEETARLAGHTLTLDRAQIRAALRAAIAQYPAEEMRIRVTLDLEQEVGVLYLLLEKLHIPSDDDYANGVRVVTYHLQRQNPKAKLTNFIETANRVRQSLPPGINEALMIGEEDRLLEGLSSNFFAVLEHGIWTAEQGVLSGITRSMVLEAAAQSGLRVRLEGLPTEKLSQVSEAFITSASRAVLPVTEIDGRPVASGRPGSITLQLQNRYRAMIEQALETL